MPCLLSTTNLIILCLKTQSSPLTGSSIANRPPLFASTPQSTSKELSLTVPSTTNCWVMVYGYTTEDQFEMIKQRFASYGRVLQYKGMCHPGHSNWLAIQYANELEAKKATCDNTVRIDSNIFVGVKLLDDNDPIVLHKQPRKNGDVWTGFGDSLAENGPESAASASKANVTVVAPGLTEKDILVQGTPVFFNDRNENICMRMLRWFLGAPPADLLAGIDQQ